MAVLDKGVKQRMIGALVLVALAVIFLPMLFSREDETRQVQVEAPQAPGMPSPPQVQVEPVPVPEPQAVPEEAPVVVDESTAPVAPPSTPIAPSPSAAPAPQASAAPAPKVEKPAAPAAKPAPANKVDGNGLPVSWSIQLASLSNRAGADNLQKTLRSQGYNAYIRAAGGMNRVFVGPLIDRAEAERLRDVINRQQKLKGFVVRFQPERG
ncbi:Cell division protein DedD [Pseudomonas fluorescens]|uniref:SPOR domain-containing protein n=1 Tax=Pseudomonas fluorescens TaxID=294 RepID=UPI001252742C|nr:SPOR domain-containing protein [Pseudomonas fluorescens]CAG8865405.1 Cell division protein DedD [Pseudomonas fluorescens]VVP67023.1 Cell division protein DedD [Pseudomonas fluorescens]